MKINYFTFFILLMVVVFGVKFTRDIGDRKFSESLVEDDLYYLVVGKIDNNYSRVKLTDKQKKFLIDFISNSSDGSGPPTGLKDIEYFQIRREDKKYSIFDFNIVYINNSEPLYIRRSGYFLQTKTLKYKGDFNEYFDFIKTLKSD